MKRLLPLLLLLPLLAACRDSEETADTHTDWEARNAQWFAEVYDQAQAAIQEAKAQYPDPGEWEDHCQWRVYKSLLKSPETAGVTTDHVVCQILERGTGDRTPAYTDSVRIYYRGWIMDENYPVSRDNMTVFSQTYYGDFDPRVAAPVSMSVQGTVDGFLTALQYMVEGDDWLVYIPQQLAYGENASDAIPAYSTLLYRLRVERVHRSGTGMPAWR